MEIIMKKNCIILLYTLCIASLSMLYSVQIQQNLSENLLRMHVIANSNSLRDQGIKLSVRNRILKESGSAPNISVLENAAIDELSKNSADYGAKVSLERCYVPEKQYKNIRLPEGMYNCVRVVLGSGAGENWWCVAYPPLCFTEDMFGEMSIDGRSQLETALNESALKTIVDGGGINFRFKIVEEMQKLRRSL